jgi:hypothetical protein
LSPAAFGGKRVNLTTPSWFNLRQGKTEPAGTDAFRLTAPNLKPAWISIQKEDNGRWSAALRLGEESPPVAVTEPDSPSPEEAWEAAFELYRLHVVV